MISVLLVEDDDAFRSSITRVLTSLGCEVRAAATLSDAREELGRGAVDLALVDYELPDGTGDELIRWSLLHGRARSACCITARASCRNVVEAMRAGSFDVLEKPLQQDQLAALVRARQPTLPAEIHAWRLAVAPDLIGDDQELCDALAIVRNVADTTCTVLIHGESGTGKELVARALHESSPRRTKPFVALNCAAIPESLIEAELFGHTRGAFTGATAAREGSLASANGGTLLLDEVGDMPLSAQAKLLRVLQERKLTPIGSDRPVAIDVRIVAATHCDLEQMVSEERFRPDLFFRLSVVRVELPPLRQRPGDILPLARHFLDHVNRRTHRACTGFDAAAERALLAHPWPGNVRELSNVVERAVLLCTNGTIRESHLRLRRRASRATPPATPARTLGDVAFSRELDADLAAAAARTAAKSLNLKDAITDVERQLIVQALERSGGNRSEAAALLGLNRTTLIEKIRKLDV